LQIDPRLAVGRAYDGASFVRGEHAGVQKRIRRVAPSAVYVHCNARCVDLALQDAARKVPLAVVQECSVFIHMSGNRQQ